MNNPLLNDISNISNEKLSNCISDLTNKYFMTRNSDVKCQIQNILEIYKAEYYIRQQKELEESMNKLNKHIEDLIRIK